VRPLVAISTKTYFSLARTRTWVAQVASLGPRAAVLGADLAVLPTFPALPASATALAGSGVWLGAQDVAAGDAGNQTGEVTAAVLAEVGCRLVEVGHAERRARGEGRDVVRAKTARVVEAGLVPLLCVGEPDRGSAAAASAHVVGEVQDALGDLGEVPVVVAYEPVWAIGAASGAPAAHVVEVVVGLRGALAELAVRPRVLYGGAAGRGTATDLGTTVDGLFLGRFAHDVADLAAVLEEVAAIRGDGTAGGEGTAPTGP
jgi:triosephosphate isomerase